jgi:CBS domain-containing protein
MQAGHEDFTHDRERIGRMVTADLRVRDLMKKDLLTLERTESLRDALEAMIEAGVGGAPVQDQSRLIGVLSLRDILAFQMDEPAVPTFRPEASGDVEEPVQQSPDEEAMLDEEMEEDDAMSVWFHDLWDDAGADVFARLQNPTSPEWDILDEHTVDEVMTRRVITVPPDAPVRSAAKKMTEEHVHRLLVVEDGSPVGILTTSDVVKAVAQGR